MTIVDLNYELPELIKEYSLIRVQDLDRTFPYTAISFIEDMMNDWKEESLKIKENSKSNTYKVKFNLHKKLGCYWSPIYTDSALVSKRIIIPYKGGYTIDNPTVFNKLKRLWDMAGRKRK